MLFEFGLTVLFSCLGWCLLFGLLVVLVGRGVCWVMFAVWIMVFVYYLVFGCCRFNLVVCEFGFCLA